MKKIVIIFVFIILACSDGTNDKTSYTKFVVHNGINISHWLSDPYLSDWENDPYYSEIMKKSDIERIAAAGFDHIRLPVSEENLFRENGEIIDLTKNLIHDAINWCDEAGIKIILDLHFTRTHNNNVISLWNSVENKEKFISLWQAISSEYGHYPVSLLAYELLNEPSAPTNDDLNKLMNSTIAIIRKSEPHRMIVVNANHNGGSWDPFFNIGEYELPVNDKNIMLSLHFYEPFILTHYKIPWNQHMKDITVPLNYPMENNEKLFHDSDYNSASEQEKSILNKWYKHYGTNEYRTMLQTAVSKAKQHGVQLYVGEYGTYFDVDIAIRREWTRDIKSVLKELNISHAFWDYKYDFGVYKIDKSIPYPYRVVVLDQELLHVITQ